MKECVTMHDYKDCFFFIQMLVQRRLFPFRLIVSSIGIYNYNLAKYLCNLLTPHTSSEHCATDRISRIYGFVRC